MFSTTTWRCGSAKTANASLKSANIKEKKIGSVKNVQETSAAILMHSWHVFQQKINECFCYKAKIAIIPYSCAMCQKCGLNKLFV